MHVAFLEFCKNVLGYFPLSFFSSSSRAGWAQVVYVQQLSLTLSELASTVLKYQTQEDS